MRIKSGFVGFCLGLCWEQVSRTLCDASLNPECTKTMSWQRVRNLQRFNLWFEARSTPFMVQRRIIEGHQQEALKKYFFKLTKTFIFHLIWSNDKIEYVWLSVHYVIGPLGYLRWVLEWIEWDEMRDCLFGDYQFRFRFFSDELEETSVDGPFSRVLNPRVEEFSDKFEWSPCGEVGLRHPLTVHGSI